MNAIMSEEPSFKRIKLEQEQKEEKDNRTEKDVIDWTEKDVIDWTEKDVGISEYINKQYSLKLFGIIKQRYSDFIVHEISLNGDITRLTNFDLPSHTKEESVVQLNTLLSSEDVLKCQQVATSSDLSCQIELQVPDSKDVRTAIHKSIRNNFPNLDSRTLSGNTVRVFLRGNKGEVRSRWPTELGNYIKCVLYKENKDTMQAISLLCKIVKPSAFQYAGTKDKRGITSQCITVYRIEPKQLVTVNGASTGIKLGNFEYSKAPLKLGDMKGNHFTIIIREVVIQEGIVLDDMLISLKENGFINYFGMQRFGTSSIPTHHIGRALIHSNWNEAVDLILKPRAEDPTDIKGIRSYYYESKDIKGTLSMFPVHKHNSIEYHLLKGLDKHGPNNILGALSFLPRNTRLMYVHSYQSYIWNRMVSYRFQIDNSLVPIPGDLVYESEDRVKILTEEECSLYNIYDIVLPLPGHSVIYPNNDVGKEYSRILEEDNLTIDSFKHRVKDFSLYGDYRHVIIKPGNLQWQLVTYDDVTVPLHQSDLDILEGKQPPTEHKGNKTALKLEFTLPTATYATMCLRELLRIETSSRVQAQLTKYIK